jgi:S-formylglutathione hydrolase FrmB
VPKQGLPALILLHGAWDDWTAWSDMAHRDLQRLATEHRLILVLPDGEPFGWYLDSDRVPGNNIQTYLTDELLPDVAEHLPVDGTWGIGGLSMGGNGAIVTAMKHPGRFRSVSSMSGAVDLEVAKSRTQLQDLLGTYDEAPALWQAWSARHLLAADPEGAQRFALRLSTGDKDKSWTGPNEALHAQLDAQQVSHVWLKIPGGHTWDVWKSLLPGDVAWHAGILHGQDSVIDTRQDADTDAPTVPDEPAPETP